MGLLDTVKSAFNLAKKINNIELQTQLIDVQAKILELQQENADLNEKVKRLEDKSVFEASRIFERNCYWTPSGDKREGPFCSPCWDGGKGPIRLHIDEGGGSARCQICGTYVEWERRSPGSFSMRPSNF